MAIDAGLQGKLDDLKSAIRSMDRVVVTFSGGVDSTLLLKMAVDVLGGERVLAVTAVSPIHPLSERRSAEELAAAMGARHVMFDPREMEDDGFAANPRERCYHCKTRLFAAAREVALEEGFSVILEGSNVDDLNDFRPGRRASIEAGVRSPLLDAGLTKDEIRLLSRELGLATHDKPAQACLATRIPYGTRITAERLGRIERSEEFIRGLGIRQVRVRSEGATARIETSEDELPLILGLRDEIAARLTDLGFTYVCLDLMGYRTGSMNEEE